MTTVAAEADAWSRRLRVGGPAFIVLGWAFVIGADWQALESWGSTFVYGLGESAFLLVGLMAPAAFVCGLFLTGLVRGNRTDWIAAAVVVALSMGGLATTALAHRHLRHAAVLRVDAQARPLVQAIEAYTGRQGRPPGSLSALVPTDLPSIPTTGMAAFPAFRYELPGVAGHVARQTEDPWMLRIDTAFGSNFDSMVYLPSGRYPAVGWGGAVVPVGKWAYVWE